MYQSLADLSRKAEEEKKEFWEVVLEDDCRERQLSRETSFGQMKAMYQAMKEADASYDPSLYSRSGLTGRDGGKMQRYVDRQETICGPFLGRVMEKALKMGESNACMKRIVAAPTAGSCGVLPAVLLPLARAGEAGDEAICEALYVAAGFGQVIAARATLAGAEGGCQAEVGAASAMAAAALCYLKGGTPAACAAAAAMALGNLLGLVCDPVAGLVEVPCVKRNVVGAVNAVACANMALSGIDSAIPCDEVIDAMGRVGRQLSPDLRETGLGGLAATPTGRAIARRLAAEAGGV